MIGICCEGRCVPSWWSRLVHGGWRRVASLLREAIFQPLPSASFLTGPQVFMGRAWSPDPQNHYRSILRPFRGLLRPVPRPVPRPEIYSQYFTSVLSQHQTFALSQQQTTKVTCPVSIEYLCLISREALSSFERNYLSSFSNYNRPVAKEDVSSVERAEICPLLTS